MHLYVRNAIDTAECGLVMFMGDWMRSTKQVGLTLVILLFGIWAGSANAAPLYSTCSSEVEKDVESFICQLRTGDGKPMKDVGVEVNGAGEVQEFTATPYSWVTNQTAFYFVVQSTSLSSEQQTRMYKFLNRMAYPAGKQKMGLATAGSSFKEEAPLNSSRLRIDNALRAFKSLIIEPGEKSVVLSSVETAIENVAAEQADRRAVIIVSGSEPTAEGLDESKVIRMANENKVALYFVSFGGDSNNPSDVLTRLGRDTHGGAYSVSDMSDDNLLEFASELSSHLENGFIVKFNARGLPQSSEIKLSGSIDNHGRETAEAVTVERQTEDDLLDLGLAFVGDHIFLILATLGLGVGGVLVFRSIGARKRYAEVDDYDGDSYDSSSEYEEGDEDEFAGETRILGMAPGEVDKPKAWLVLVGAQGERVPLLTGNIQLGRHKDSDIRLTNSSVHRQHAVIQMDADGTFSIHDLGTKNGVFVNGNKYNQRTLVDGDVIELGEVKLRFEAASE